jgi:hypothetical protein
MRLFWAAVGAWSLTGCTSSLCVPSSGTRDETHIGTRREGTGRNVPGDDADEVTPGADGGLGVYGGTDGWGGPHVPLLKDGGLGGESSDAGTSLPPG